MERSTVISEIRKSVSELFRYGIVGIAHNVSGYLVYLLITYWGVEPKKAMTMLYLVGATIGFIGHRKWTFAHQGTVLGAGARHVIAHLGGYLLNLIILLIFVDGLGWSHQFVQAAAIFVVAAFLFVTFKYFVFPKAAI